MITRCDYGVRQDSAVDSHSSSSLSLDRGYEVGARYHIFRACLEKCCFFHIIRKKLNFERFYVISGLVILLFS